MPDKINLFLDSGAFSAFTQNQKIDIQEYIKFIKQNEEHIEIYANLDVIGDAEGTLKNQNIMEKAGLDPIPTFHFGEDVEYLRYYLKNYDHIALGGMVPISNVDLQGWLDDIFGNYICDKSGMPTVKVHGFGMTAFTLMWRYPWYSLDSTSWLMTARMGGILVPQKSNGGYDYRKSPLKIDVSSRSSSIADDMQHYSTFPPTIQEEISLYVKSKGFVIGDSEFRLESPKYKLLEGERWHGKEEGGKRRVEKVLELGLSNNYMQRDVINILYFQDLEAHFPVWPWPFKKSGVQRFDLFGEN